MSLTGGASRRIFRPRNFTQKKIHCFHGHVTNFIGTIHYKSTIIYLYICNCMHLCFQKHDVLWSLRPKDWLLFPQNRRPTYSSSNTHIQVKNGSIKSDPSRSCSTHIPIQEFVKWLLIWWESHLGNPAILLQGTSVHIPYITNKNQHLSICRNWGP